MLGQLPQEFIDELIDNITNKPSNDIDIYDFINCNPTAALMIGLEVSFIAKTCAAINMDNKKANNIFDNVVENIDYMLKSISDYNDIFIKYIPMLKKEIEKHPRTTSILAISEFFITAYRNERGETESKQFYRFMVSLGIILANIFHTETSKVIKFNLDTI